MRQGSWNWSYPYQQHDYGKPPVSLLSVIRHFESLWRYLRPKLRFSGSGRGGYPFGNPYPSLWYRRRLRRSKIEIGCAEPRSGERMAYAFPGCIVTRSYLGLQ